MGQMSTRDFLKTLVPGVLLTAALPSCSRGRANVAEAARSVYSETETLLQELRELRFLSGADRIEHNEMHRGAFRRVQRSVEKLAREAGIEVSESSFEGKYQPGPHSIGGPQAICEALGRCQQFASELRYTEGLHKDEIRDLAGNAVASFVSAIRLYRYFEKE